MTILDTSHGSSSLIRQLQQESQEESALAGALPSLFGNDSDHEDAAADSTSSNDPPENLEECTVTFGDDRHSLRILQSTYAFGASGDDDTGGVLWGAALRLADFLADLPDPFLRDRRVVELGCGCGLASLAAAVLGAGRVVATDFRRGALDRVVRHARINGVDGIVGAEVLDWEDRERGGVRHSFDVVLASDVIYGMDKVLPLISTIDETLTEDQNGAAIIATRDGRRGVEEFIEAMCSVGFRIEQTQKIIWKDDRLEEVPSYFCGEETIHRWKANHSIYVFRRSLS